MIPRFDNWPYLPRALLFALSALLLTLAFSANDAFQWADFDLSDTHSRWFAPQVNFEDVVMIDVDEESITQLQPKLGAWPYDREVYALTLDWLKRMGVSAVGFDILFAEGRKGDDQFADALDERVVLAAAGLPFTFERDGAYRAQLANKSWGAAPSAGVYGLTDLTLPRAQLTQRAGIGVVSVPLDSDGILRRVPLVFSAYGQLVPAMALALSQAAAPLATRSGSRSATPSGSAAPQVAVSEGRLSAGAKSWPVSPLGEVVLRYPANLDTLRTVPFYQVALAASGAAALQPLADALGASLRGKRVLIGSTSAALGDHAQTPLGRLPGVKLQAMIAGLLAGGHVLKPRSAAWEMFLATCVALLVLVAGLQRWQSNKVVQWSVIPLVVVLVGVVAAIAQSHGQAMGLLFAISAGVLTHLTGLLFQQAQLYRRNQRLEMEKRAALQADALKSQFLSHITHELRTPLTAIMGFNNINWHGNDLGRDQRISNSEIVDRNCQHMLSLVNNLLDQAKIDAGQLTIQRHPDKLRAVVQEAVATVEPLLRGKPVKLRCDEIDVPEVLDIDAFRLRQILLNLLSNAIKFIKQGEISVVSAWHEDELTISVVDSGPGMSEDVVKRLFTAFQQADAGIAATHGGTGLGLTISRNLARLMGGDIRVHSQLGQGAVFTVTVKAARPQAGDELSVSQAAEPPVRNVLQGLVLVAEDMADTRAQVARHLEQLLIFS